MRLPADQAWLLRAALLPEPAAGAAWRRWRAGADLATIDRGSTRLLPLLWHNLLANGIDDPWLPRFKGVYRHTWFGNQLRLRRLREIEATLAARGVSGLVLKGIALACAYYPNPGLRPMDDLDLLIAPADVPTAIAALRDAGWSSPIRRPERVLQVVHGTELQAADGERLDLHGHLFQGSLASALDEQRRARAELLDLPDGPLAVLEPTDQLLHTLVHGVESDPPAPRWLADATMILRRNGPAIDWPRLLADADAESRSLAVARALGQLVAVVGAQQAPVPAEVLAELRGRRTSLAERLEQRISGGPRLFAIGYLAQRVVDHRRWQRSAANGVASGRRSGLVGYLRLNWDVDSIGELPGQVLRRGLRSVGADVGRLAGRPRASDGAAGRSSGAA